MQSADHAAGADLDRLAQWAAATPHHRLLDVATGGGHAALRLAPHVRRTILTDLTAEMLVAACDHLRRAGVPRPSACQAAAECLPFRDGAFDRVTCRLAAHHFADPAAAVAEMARVLAPGGLLLFSDLIAPEDDAGDRFLNAIERLRDPSHVRSYRVSEWRTLVARAPVPLRLERCETIAARLEIGPWLERAATPPAARAA